MLTVVNTAAVYAEKDPALWIAIVEACLGAGDDFRAKWIGAVHPEFAALTAAAQRRSEGKIAFEGARSNADVGRELQLPRRVLLISSRIEVFPMSILEATQLGVPVVCRRFPGWEEVLDPDYPLSFTSIAEALACLRSTAENYAAFSDSARAIFSTRFQKDVAWYATGEALMERLTRTHP